ncbi:hypothetical protein [Kineococcus sp. SYSU DK004]|uniref:hypothetical protein n=1 Tax=Kineococcus sp. SYSU DK004 TaxID=3383125 RepID=UPI003D7D5398
MTGTPSAPRPPARRAVPADELPGLLRHLPPVDGDRWLADAREDVDQEPRDPWGDRR